MTDQTRRSDGKFRSAYSDERRYELLRLVALRANPLDPTSLSQPQFDRRAPEVAAQQGWPPPPKANAIYMHLTRQRKRTWRQLVETAVTAADGTFVGTVRAATREFPAWWFDERHIVFGLRRVLYFRQQQEAVKVEAERRTIVTLTRPQYEVGRAELLDSVRGERREYLDMVLPTAGQIIVMAGQDWNMALRLAGLPEPVAARRPSITLFTLMDHYYNAEKRIPNYGELRAAYNALGISVPKHPRNWAHFLDQWRADRTARELDTPTTGPSARQRLSEIERAALLEGAPRLRRPGAWTPELILERFSEYVAEYDGVASLTQAHFKVVRVGTDWPSWTTIYDRATPGRKTGWGEMVERGRQWLTAQERPAA